MPSSDLVQGHDSASRSRRQKPHVFVALGVVLCLAASLHADLATEYQVKAGFLYNFAKFVTWTPETFNEGHQLFNICVSGDRSWDRALEETLKGKTVDGRVIVSRSIHSEKDVKGCQVLFVPAPEESKWESLMLDAKLPGVLTVTEGSREGKHRKSAAVITFVLDENRVRFVINTKAAEKAGLVISSRLLSLALEIQQ
jgi:hypothetical protein